MEIWQFQVQLSSGYQSVPGFSPTVLQLAETSKMSRRAEYTVPIDFLIVNPLTVFENVK